MALRLAARQTRRRRRACAYAAVVLTLSVLDQSPIPSGATSADALQATLDLAEVADRLGYHRYWLAEHHSFRALAGTAPEILISQVAARTRRIRIGSGGVMLPHYSALKVAESFRMLQALFGDRIDLGIGRAPGSDQLTAAALRSGGGPATVAQFPEQVAELLGFLHDSLPTDHPFARVRVMPEPSGAPDVWLLGSGGDSAACAAYFGLPYSYAHFINPHGGPQQISAYSERFQAGPYRSSPEASMCVSTICAESDSEAQRLASSLRLWRLRLEQGDPGPIPSVEEAEFYPYTPAEEARMMELATRFTVGAPEHVADRLSELAEAHGVSEVLIVTICHDPRARIRSYELIAEAFGIGTKTEGAEATASTPTC